MADNDKQIRRDRAKRWAQEYQARTGKGPGDRGYIDSFFYGYFDHSMASARGIEGVVLDQFESLLDRIEAMAATFTVISTGQPSPEMLTFSSVSAASAEGEGE